MRTETPPSPRSSGVDPLSDAELAAEDEELFYSGKGGDEEWIRFRRPWNFWQRALLLLAVLGAGVGAVAWFCYDWVQRQLDPPGEPEGEISVEIPSGSGVSDIARMLTEQGVVANAVVTRLAWRNSEIQAGEYVLARNMSVDQALEVLNAGPLPDPFIKITIPEGLWLSEITERLLDGLPEFDPEELNRAISGGGIRSEFQPPGVNSLEGLLFGETYHVDEASEDDEAALVERMVEQFDLVAAELGYDTLAEAAIGLSPYEVITIASMVEEEAFRDEDRPKVARVIYNRINEGMPLGIDATVLYAIGERKTDITRSDLDVDSPYNTRKYRGIPPGPISSPGRKSLEAALRPAVGDWLYFVLAARDGTLFFTDDYEEFLRVADEARREGVF